MIDFTSYDQTDIIAGNPRFSRDQLALSGAATRTMHITSQWGYEPMARITVVTLLSKVEGDYPALHKDFGCFQEALEEFNYLYECIHENSFAKNITIKMHDYRNQDINEPDIAPPFLLGKVAQIDRDGKIIRAYTKNGIFFKKFTTVADAKDEFRRVTMPSFKMA